MKKFKFNISQSHVASRVVHGPGSMFGEAEALALASSGRFQQAADHVEEHNRLIPPEARRISKVTIDIWRKYEGFVP
jgi:hypothetical protein